MTTSSAAATGLMRLALILTALGGAPAPASASDAEMQAALRRANCGAPAIKELLRRGDLAVYEPEPEDEDVR